MLRLDLCYYSEIYIYIYIYFVIKEIITVTGTNANKIEEHRI